MTFNEVKTYAALCLKTAQAEFKRHPSSLHFRMVTRAMMVYQQVDSIRLTEAQNELVGILTPLPLGEWPDAIVNMTCGLSVYDALTTGQQRRAFAAETA